MIPAGSRYEQAERNFTLAHMYSERGLPLLAGELGMTNLRVRTALREALFRMTTQPDVAGTTMVYYAKETETMQFLGFKFLDDPKRWHEVADLNMQVWYPLDLKPGQIMRAPIS
jgi:hypothetical protein